MMRLSGRLPEATNPAGRYIDLRECTPCGEAQRPVVIGIDYS
jgi:hypothetical protein